VERGERRALIDQVRKRAVATASNVAAVSTSALLTYNYVTLEQNAARVAREEDILYVIILDREGKVAAHSSRSDLQGTVLPDPVSRRAGASREILVQAAPSSGTGDPLYDVAVPVYIKESPKSGGRFAWGFPWGPWAGPLPAAAWASL